MSFEDYGVGGHEHREPDAHELEHDVDPLDQADALEEESDWISWHAAEEIVDVELPVFGPLTEVEAPEPTLRPIGITDDSIRPA